MNKILIDIVDKRYIKIITERELSNIVLKELINDNNSIKNFENNKYYTYTFPLLSYNSFVIKCISEKFNNIIFKNENIKDIILESAEATILPTADLINEQTIGIKAPSIYSYSRLFKVLNARNQMLNLWVVPLSRLYEIYRYFKIWKHPFLPKIQVSDRLKNIMTEPLEDINPSIEDLFNVDLKELSTIKGAMKIPGKWRLKDEGFKKLKYESAVDLILSKPKSYQDRSSLTSFTYAPFGEKSYVKCKIIQFTSTFNNAGKLIVTDDTMEVEIIIYGAGWQTKIYSPGDIIILEVVRVGPKTFKGNSIISEEEVKALPVIPNYRQSPSNNIRNPLLINATQEFLLRYNGTELFNYIKEPTESFWESLENLHFPQDAKNFEKTLENLAYYELICLQLIFLESKAKLVESKGIPKKCDNPILLKDSLEAFSFSPTLGQKEAIKKIIKELESDRAEKILLSGDVGTGKSLVANSACFYTVDCGYQAVLVGPTEILAQQLYDGINKQIKNMKHKPTIAFISGNTKQKEKKELEKLIRDGYINIVVGTHSVLDLEYSNLGLLVVDEQQKFGRSQREKLNMSRKDGKVIDILEQTATPIPQSTARAFYGDIKLISLTEKPGKRKENITKWIRTSSKEFLTSIYNPVWEHIFKEIDNGHQIFIVTPAVEEDSKSASVKKTMKILQNKYPNLKIDYIHGGLKKDKQNKVIEQFRDNKISVLIASSIVEVGIDIPNSTIMLVLDAHKFGASSLHQIRGRVGRSDLQGYCYLIGEATTKNAERRLQALVDSNNGFDIALVDLETRNTGNLFGEQQSGESNLRFCSLVNHSDLIEKAQFEAEFIFNSDKMEQALKDAKIFLNTEGKTD